MNLRPIGWNNQNFLTEVPSAAHGSKFQRLRRSLVVMAIIYHEPFGLNLGERFEQMIDDQLGEGKFS